MISEGSCDTEDWSNDAENKSFKNMKNNTVAFAQFLSFKTMFKFKEYFNV